MNDKVKGLLRLAVRLQDVKNLFDEGISVSPHASPGMSIDNMLGGPQSKKFKHQTHDAPRGPRGIAEVEESEDEEV